MITGLGIAVIIYMLVAVAVVTVLTPSELETINESEGRALLEVVSKGAPDFPIDKVFPFLAVFAVANTALINMLMASRLLYGMARQNVLPRQFGFVSNRQAPYVSVVFTTAVALGLIWYVAEASETEIVSQLSGTTSLLLLGVFAVVNVACLILRRDPPGSFKSPGWTPAIAAVACLFLIGPWVDRDPLQYKIAASLLGIGVVLWGITYFIHRPDRPQFENIDELL